MNYSKEDLEEMGFVYEPDSGRILCTKKRSNRWPPGEMRTVASNGYLKTRIKGKEFTLHRMAFYLMGKTIPKGMQVDHINGVKDDNRWSNLRLATPRENMSNQKNHRNGKLIGANKAKANRFYSEILVKGKRVRLGTFDTAEQAHQAYMKARKELE